MIRVLPLIFERPACVPEFPWAVYSTREDSSYMYLQRLISTLRDRGILGPADQATVNAMGPPRPEALKLQEMTSGHEGLN